MAEPRDGFVQANGLRLHYCEWGHASKPPLLLLHGFGNQAHIWDPFAETVVDRFHIYALDSRGHGDSDHAGEYGDTHNADDTVAVIDALGLTRLTLIGFSMGAANAMILISRRPDIVERLVIVDRGPESDPRGRERMARAISQARATFPDRDEALAYIRMANPRRSEALVQASLQHAFRALPDGTYQLKYDQKLRDRFMGHGGSGVDLWNCLEAVKCPTLIVRGGESDILPPAVAERMVDMLPDARLEIVPGAGHTVMLDNPEGFNRVVGAFLP
jgi:pimeloyl-ACP methyl ester carboxylesterase